MRLSLSATNEHWPVHLSLNIKLAAAHEETAISVGTAVLAFLIDQFGVADRTVVPPVILGFNCIA
jgi:hypothetical protein